MAGLLTVLLVAIVSLISQLNLKYVSSILIVDGKIIFPENKLYLCSLIFQSGIPALLSLLLTIYGYSRFPFFQFMIFQTVYFIFAILVDRFFFGGQFSARSILSVGFILLGIALASAK